MIPRQPHKVIKIGDSLAIIIPAEYCRDLSIHRGDYFDLVIGGPNIMVARRLKIVAEDQFGEAPDNTVPTIQHDE